MTTALLFLEPLLPISVPPTMAWLTGDIRRVQVTLDFDLRVRYPLRRPTIYKFDNRQDHPDGQT